MNKAILRILAVVLIILAALPAQAGYTVEEVPNVQKADRTRYVSDPKGYLSTATRATIDSLLSDIRRQTSAEVAFVIIDKMEPAGNIDIDTYGTELFEQWGIGDKDKDNGVLMLVSIDDRKFVLRPGYGAEGVLPDMICREITENKLVPAMKAEDYDRGMLEVAREIHKTMTDKRYREELKADIEARKSEEWFNLLYFIMAFAAVLTLALAAVLIIKLARRKGMSPYEKYLEMRPLKPVVLVCCFFGLGLPLLVYLPLVYLLNKWRDGVHLCPNCKARMNKLDEESDNKYLTPAQDAEERFDSVDYDVWLCPDCGETDVYPYANSNSVLKECPNCHARTLRQLQDRIVQQPTPSREGRGVREFVCLNCGHRHNIHYAIAKTATPGIIILPGGFGGGRGGGSIGGGFGGGSTGGGGFSGGW